LSEVLFWWRAITKPVYIFSFSSIVKPDGIYFFIESDFFRKTYRIRAKSTSDQLSEVLSPWGGGALPSY